MSETIADKPGPHPPVEALPVGPAASPPAETALDGWLLAGIVGLFGLMSIPLMRSDLWFDELLTLTEFALPGNWLHPFTHYPIANNHIWFSALLRLWMWMVDYSPAEEVMRFPCFLMAVGTIFCAYALGRRLVDGGFGLLLAGSLGLSPIFMSFAWQLRGYSLTMLLATLATFGALFLARGARRLGLWLAVPAWLLLPGVMPTNVLFTCSLFAFLNAAWWRRGQWLAYRRLLLPLGLAAVGGMAVYLPVWNDFLRVARTTAGWQSGFDVVANWAVALAAQSAMLVATCYALSRDAGLAERRQSHRLPSSIRDSGWLAVCCLVPLVAVALLRAPFPRSLLAYLPALTVCSLFLYRRYMASLWRHRLLLVALVAGNGFFWHRVTDYRTCRQLLAGETPQHLLLQYYSRSRDVGLAAQFLAHSPGVPSNVRILVPFPIFQSFGFYWMQQRRPRQHVECLGGSDRFALRHRPEYYQRYPQAVLAYSESQALAYYRETFGHPVQLQPLASVGILTVFRVVGAPSGLPVHPNRDRRGPAQI